MRRRSYQSENLIPIFIIILLNLFIFIAALVDRGLILQLFSLWKPVSFIESIVNRPWTLITCVFTHVQIWHIFANMLTFFFFGRLLVRLIGARNLLLVYFCGGIVASIFFLLIARPSPIPAVGASGAVFALGGVLTILTPKLKVFIIPIPVPIPLWIAIIGGFIILSLIPSVAWQAHLGGLIVGLLFGLYYRNKIPLIIY